jgi:hypothetical protein
MSGLISRLRTRLLLELDGWHWRRQASTLKSSAPSPTKTMLICDLMTTFATSKVQALFAAAMRGRGFRVVVLLPGPYSLLERLYTATGPTEFVYFSDFSAQDDESEYRQQAGDVLNTLIDGAGLLLLEVDGYRIGRNALSLAVRKLRVGTLDFRTTEHREVVEASLFESLRAKQRASRLVEAVRPDLVLFLERGYSPAGEMFDACLLNHVDVVQWLGAPQSDRFLFKRYNLATRGSHPLALAAATWNQIRHAPLEEDVESRVLTKLAANYAGGAWFNRQQLQEGKQIFDRSETLRRLGVTAGRKVAVVFSHILYDATFFYGNSLFPDYETWLIETVRCAIANTHLDWVIKVHPVNVWRSRMDGQPMEQLEARAIANAIGELPSHVRLLPADTDINTYSLFEAIDVGLTVRGTIGMELPCWGVPVVTAGTGRYSGNGFTIDPTSQGEYREVLSRLHLVSRLDAETASLARRYAWGTFFGRPVPVESFVLDFHANTYGLKALTQNTKLAEEVKRSGVLGSDLESIADWMESGRNNDLLSFELCERSADDTTK